MTDDLAAVIGAGPLGLAVARALRGEGRAVRLVSRSGRPSGLPGVDSHAADVMDPAAAVAALAGAGSVFQCAAPAYHRWPEEFPRLQANVLQGAARADAVLVAAENLYGYGIAGELTEDLPLAAATRKGRTRAELTRALFAAHARGDVRTVAGRAADFLGPGVRQSAYGERFWPAVLKGGPVAWFGDPDQPHSVTYVPDFARALVRLSREEDAWGRAWHVPTSPARSPRRVAADAARLAGRPAPKMGHTPALVLRAVGLVVPAAAEVIEMGYSYRAPFVLRDDAYRAAFGEAPTPWEEALAATLDAWRASGAQAA